MRWTAWVAGVAWCGGIIGCETPPAPAPTGEGTTRPPAATSTPSAAASTTTSAAPATTAPVAVCTGGLPDPICFELPTEWLAKVAEVACPKAEMKFERGGTCPLGPPIFSCLVPMGFVRHSYPPISEHQAGAECQLGATKGAVALKPGSHAPADASSVVSCVGKDVCTEEHAVRARLPSAKQDCEELHEGRFVEGPCARSALVGECVDFVMTRYVYSKPAHDLASARKDCDTQIQSEFAPAR
jgi:hypothetical protein